MAFTFTKVTPTTGAVAMYELKERLKTAGWTGLASSDGTTYNSTGDGITGGSSGANGFANNSAWVRLRSPAGGGSPEITIQRGTTNLVWRIKYSMAAGFSGGSPGATQTPSATDEAIIWGGGSDASPTFGALFTTDGTYRWNVGADNASPYGFWAGAFATGGGNPSAGVVFEPLVQTEPSDAHTYAIYVGGSSPFALGSLSQEGFTATTNNLVSSVASTSPGASDMKFFSALNLRVGTASAGVVPGDLATNPITSKDEVLPILIARRSALATPGYKGVLTLMKWTGTTRTTGDTLSVSSSRDRIIYRDVSLPWDGSIPSV